jgi:hypothetical protein
MTIIIRKEDGDRAAEALLARAAAHAALYKATR